MKNTYSIVIAMMILVSFGGISSVEAGDKDKAASLVQNACKDKKPGDNVKVAGRDMKCPSLNKSTDHGWARKLTLRGSSIVELPYRAAACRRLHTYYYRQRGSNGCDTTNIL